MAKMRLKEITALSALTASLLALATQADACTRVTYLGNADAVMTARSMDWSSDTRTNLWAFPRGIARDGQTGRNPLRWTSRYGSVVAAAYDKATVDGLNEKGLAANLLWLTEAKYPAWDGSKPGLSIASWTQYVLDNFATVNEVVGAMQKQSFDVVGGHGMPGEAKEATLHLAVSDASGDSAIFEYLDGKLVVHHNRAYQVMTNSPTFDQQLALDTYWKGIGGDVMLPGTHRASDRFVRASFYTNAIPKDGDTATTVASVFSVIRNTSVPYGVSTPGHPNLASTLWRTVADQQHRVYYFESALTPNTFWVDLKALDLSAGAPAGKLDLSGRRTYEGEVSGKFVKAAPFTLL